MHRRTCFAVVAALLLALPHAGPAFAKGGRWPQTHHCEIGGKEVVKTKKQCKAGGGTWAKGAPTSPAAPAAAPPAPPAR